MRHERQICRRGENLRSAAFLDTLPTGMFDLPKGAARPGATFDVEGGGVLTVTPVTRAVRATLIELLDWYFGSIDPILACRPRFLEPQ